MNRTTRLQLVAAVIVIALVVWIFIQNGTR